MRATTRSSRSRYWSPSSNWPRTCPLAMEARGYDRFGKRPTRFQPAPSSSRREWVAVSSSAVLTAVLGWMRWAGG
ncbi:hypothetical protein [Alicyclobacillus macrosporangiidus]|uniref:hypothetical protein n=1 Tax=Alicyclobacillus macrosporangiidus TaxID=392015 RepID=UPI0018CC6B50|nr:hypothetical protein [Alicyclobacillus macrosporangiidus]